MSARAYSIEVNGVIEAHADSRAEAVRVAHYLNAQFHGADVRVWCADTQIPWRDRHPVRPPRKHGKGSGR